MPSDKRTIWVYFGIKDSEQREAFQELTRFPPDKQRRILMRWILRGRKAVHRKRKGPARSTKESMVLGIQIAPVTGEETPPQHSAPDGIPLWQLGARKAKGAAHRQE